ncbi:acyl-CoA dehydrogenase [Marinicauda algicola]|uniref:3-methylmercaptopropionyl-CoA dehydrogenase n=1 Tax=Marinicauda algicola TaxID=2029849 RepID=A0A4S2GZA1_9PROT|nr:acyl-CoA dehydrogenase [Marinicauda algicola]TGY88476.1 acyl-CoA dehydrogenase [Marinicauda algicola]
MHYRAPVRDIRFALEEIAAMDGLKATGAFPELSGELTQQVLDEAGKLANDVLAPLNRTGDVQGCRLEDGAVTTPEGFPRAYTKYVEGGWQGLQFSTEHGGMGLPKAMGCALMEMLQSANMSFGLGPMLTFGAIEALIAHGSRQLRELYLPRVMTGEWSATMNLTEPQAGSDVGALTTRAEPNGDGSWAISGQKIYITWGEHDCADNIVHLVLARTPGSPAGTKGISLFLVPKFIPDEEGEPGERNGVRAIGLEHKMGIHGSPTCTMEYDRAKGWLVGEETKGMACMFTMMNSARLNVGVQGVAIAERAYQQALEFAKERKQGRAPMTPGEPPHAIIEHPDVRRMLAIMKAKTEAARAICFHAAVEADYAVHHEDAEERAWSKRREDLLIPIAKAWSTDVGVEVASLGVQVHGGMGYVEETGAAQHYRDARIAPIYEGTNGIQAIDLVGRKLPMQGGKPVAELIEDFQETIEDLATSSNPDLNALADTFGPAVEAMDAATGWMLKAKAEDRLAGATAYLKLAGDVTGGWLLCLGALAAQRRLKHGEGDQEHARGRIALTRVYADSVLRAVPGLLGQVRLGADALFDPAAIAMLESA